MGLKTLDKPEKLVFQVTAIDSLLFSDTESASVIIFQQMYDNSLEPQNITFVQTEEMTEAGIAVQPYGAFIMNSKAPTVSDDDFNPKPVIKFTDGDIWVLADGLYDLTFGSEVTFENPSLPM